MSARVLSTSGEGLAVEGGATVRVTPFAPWPFFAPDEIDAVAHVLDRFIHFAAEVELNDDKGISDIGNGA